MTSESKAPFKLMVSIFLCTFRIGALTFGGGYAMIPLLLTEFTQKHAWIEKEEMVDLIAVAQSIPGAIFVNASVMAGYRIARFRGVIAAAIGAALPSLVVLSILSTAYKTFAGNPVVIAALRGIRAGVTALMLSAVIDMSKPSMVNPITWILGALALLLTLFTDIHGILLILCGGLIGLLWRKAGKHNGAA